MREYTSQLKPLSMARPAAARSMGEHTAATAAAVAAALSPASWAQRSSALPPSEMPTTSSGVRLLWPQALQHPADFLEVTGVVGARRQVQLTRAAAKVRHAVGPATLARHGGEGLRVLAGAAAFQAVEEHQVLRRGRGIGPTLQVVDIDEVAIGRGPAFAAEHRRRAEVAVRAGWRPKWFAGCRPAARRGFVAVHEGRGQCKVVGVSPSSPIARSCGRPGLAWWAAMRQPSGVFT